MRIWSKNLHSFISHSFNSHFSGILDHSPSFIPHFLNSRLHFFQCIFLPFEEIWHSLCKATLGNEANRKWKIYTFSFLQTILIIFFSFELSGRLNFTIVESPKKLLMSFVTTSLSFCFCGFFKDVVSQSLIPYFQPKNASLHSLIPQFRLNFVHSQSLIPQFLQF